MQLDLPMCQILNKGLKFIPTPTLPTEENHPLLEHFEEFARALRLKYFFRNMPTTIAPTLNPFKAKSSWVPPIGPKILEKYLEVTKVALREHTINFTKNNLTLKQRIAIKQLQDNKYTIKPADKGSGIVIQNTNDYIEKGLQQLADKDTYQELSGDPTLAITTTINKYIIELFNLNYIDGNQFNYLLSKTTPRTQLIYFLTKIHKNPFGTRPIVSGNNGPTERISAFIDFFLQPTMGKINAYLKNSYELIDSLKETPIYEHTLLCTMDVSSLYTNIPQREGTQACLNLLEELDLLPMPRQYLEHLFLIVLQYNVFSFGNHVFRQIQGTAMGTKMAPAYANIFMHYLEQNFIATQPLTPLVYKRYIDDIIIIWNHTKQQLDSFIQNFNRFHPKIKFTFTISDTETIFLDLKITKTNQNTLSFSTHFKETNRFEYIQYSSAHPTATKHGIMKGEITRINRTTTALSDRQSIKKKITKHFEDRGYPTHTINTSDAQTIATTIGNRPIFKTTFYPQIIKPQKSLLKHWDLISKDPTLKTIFTETPLICFKTNKKINRSLIRAKTQGTPTIIASTPFNITAPSRILKCQKPGCPACRLLISSHNFKRKIYLPIRSFNCSSTNIIYAIVCTSCNFTRVNTSDHSLRHICAVHTKALDLSYKKNTLPYCHFKHNHAIKILPIIEATTQQANRYTRYWRRKINS